LSKTEKQETVEVKLPIEIVQFLQKYADLVGRSLDNFFSEAILNEVNNLIAESFDTLWSSKNEVIKAHHLEKYFTDNKEAEKTVS